MALAGCSMLLAPLHALGEAVTASPDPLLIMPRHSADTDGDAFSIDTNEFAAVLDYWRNGRYGIAPAEADGYAPESTDTNGVRHAADYDGTSWSIGFEEILRALALQRATEYRYTAAAPGGFAPVPEGGSYTPPDPADYTGTVRYVSAASINPVAPYTNLTEAATDIQTAIDASMNGDLIFIDSGVYNTGYRTNAYGTSRILVTKGVTLASLYGPEQTIIEGSAAEFIRGIFVNHAQAELHGLGIRHGVVNGNSANLLERDGGGLLAWGASKIRDCVIENCSATPWGSGGGAYIAKVTGRVERITARNCQANAGGGIAVFWGQSLYLDGCTLVSNSAIYGGGMIADNAPRIINLLALHNNASIRGGGISLGTFVGIWHATILHNSAGTDSGGIYFYDRSSVANSIVISNGISALSSAATNNSIINSYIDIPTNALLSYRSMVTTPPTFVDPDNGNYRLTYPSPLIDAGSYSAWMAGFTDLDGTPRTLGAAPDLGAYEMESLSAVPSDASYIPGSNLQATVTIDFPTDRKPLSLGIQLTPPAGWSVIGIEGPGTPEATAEGFVFTGDLQSSMTVTVTLFAAQATTGTVELAADLLWMADGMIDLNTSTLTPSAFPITPMYPLFLSTSGQGQLSLPTGWFPVGSTVTVSAVADPGWRFVQWLGDTNGSEMVDTTLYLVIADGPMNVDAAFIQLYQLTIASPYGSSTPPAGTQQYDDGTTILVSMSEASVHMGETQYVCTGWAGSGSVPAQGSSRSVELVITNDTQILWTWSALTASHSSRGYRAAGTYKALVECEVVYDPAPTITQVWWKAVLPSGSVITSVSGEGNPMIDNGAILIRENLTGGSFRFTYDVTLPPVLGGPLTIGGESGVNDPN
ncbi:MAG: right-handed parallel beta-helix repeat-containing protein [Kiritimatiellae bacterium]|nr:right-handed parallel beta-helix repeat-containing protein [Kiritimatiellia bacterium]